MSIKKRLIPALVASAMGLSAAVGAGNASAITFTGVHIFGDSLSDAGYFRPFLTQLGLPSATVATLGRFSTNPGPVWSEIIAQYYGGVAAPSNAGGSIYAQGGARVAVDSTSTPPGSAQRPVSTQITEYFARSGGAADPNALYSIWAGNNDIFQAGLAGVQAAAPAVVQQAARLQAAGARYILVFGSGDGGKAPGSILQGAAAVAQGTAATAGFNTLLFTGLKASGVKVIPVDTFSLLNDVIANASAFGFTNTTGVACGPFPPITTATTISAQFCGPTNLVAANAASTFIFADFTGHATTATNAIVADFVKALIDGPNAYSVMAEVPLATRAAHIRTLDEGLQQGARAAVGRWSAFASGDGGKYDLSQNALAPRTDTKNRAVTVGVTMRASEAVTVGLAVGSSKSDARMGALGQFDVDENALSAFGSVKSGGFYGNFTASLADVKYNNIQRNVKLGIVNRVASANSKGSNGSGSLHAGYDFAFGNLNVGPFIGATLQNVDVGGFTEAGAGSANLNILGQSRSSAVTSVGARASFNIGNWTPFARVSFDQEGRDDTRFVSANPVSVTAGNTYDIPAYRADSKWTTGVIGIRGRVADRVGLSLVYTVISSKESVKHDGVTGAVSIDF